MKDEGQGNVSIVNCDMGLKLALTEKDGALHVDFSDVRMNM